MNQSLYHRLGGNQGLAAIVEDTIHFHLYNPIVSARFQDSDPQKLVRLAHEFFCAGSGGPETYTGRDMRETHRGMNIDEREFMAVVDDVMKALVKHDVGQREQEEVLFILYAFRGDILHG